MDSIISRSPQETEEFGARLAREMPSSSFVIGLSGDLGAGKTRLVTGFVRARGSLARVHSPTFSLINIYETEQGPVNHLDLYRLTHPQDVLAAGLEEYLERPLGITLCEWIERWHPLGAKLPRGYMVIALETIDESVRKITVTRGGE